MFNSNKDFFPTPLEVINIMMEGETIENKTFLEPSAGKGNIVDYLLEQGAKNVLTCEINEDLRKIIQTKCKLIGADFLQLTSDKISHVDYIVMNPPFTADETHILHAYSIAPSECTIIALCNTQTIENPFSKSRKELVTVVENNGSSINLGDCFSESERKTGVQVSLIKIKKAGNDYKTEFEGFFTDEEPEGAGSIGVMSYNVVRDLVNRYVSAVKIYDKQLDAGKEMNSLISSFYGEGLAFTCTEKGAPKLREEFKKDLQKAGWKFIFAEMNLTKTTTRGLTEDINKFVEEQTNIPFTMKNIYAMLYLVNQTTGQRMDKAILEVFDRVTSHHHDNRHNIKGWKTNSHFLVGRKFILPNIVSPEKSYGYKSSCYTSLNHSWDGVIPDFEKALCYVTGTAYETTETDCSGKKVKEYLNTVNSSIDRNIYGGWYTSHFFKYKAYKNGNMHFEFVDEKVWNLFNQRVAKLKGYPLYEKKEQTAYQNRQTGRKTEKYKHETARQKPTILATIKLF